MPIKEHTTKRPGNAKREKLLSCPSDEADSSKPEH